MDGKRVRIRFDVDRAGVQMLVLALVVMVLSGSVAWAQDDPAAFSSITAAPLQQTTSGHGYYLTSATSYQGDDAIGACTADYHMASLWEIMDPSNLVYNTSLGYTTDDSGEGPPNNTIGWVRTGYGSSTSPIAGTGNCYAWTSTASDDDGTVVSLPSSWSLGAELGVWEVGIQACNAYRRVWCVED